MERGLALALWIAVTLEIVLAHILSKSGVIATKGPGHQYVADHTTLWLMIIPLVYAGFCEFARGRRSPGMLLTVTRAIGWVLLVVFILLLVGLVFDH